MTETENKKRKIKMSNIENITFGVEIETNIPVTAPVEVGGYHSGRPVEAGPKYEMMPWSAEADGSIISPRGFRPCEFVSPILRGEAGVEHLIAFVAWLKEIHAKVNSSCGFHIHVGVSSFATDIKGKARFVKILARLVTRNTTALYAQTGTAARENGGFCRPNSVADRQQITKACRKGTLYELSSNRYKLLNLTTVTGKGTVEFRCFAGTLNVNKMLCHLLSVLLLCKVAAARKSLTAWEAAERLTGTTALHNLLKVRPVFKIVEAAPFTRLAGSIMTAGFEMAAQYDASIAHVNGTALSPMETLAALAAATAPRS